jgi:hypothetical protein
MAADDDDAYTLVAPASRFEATTELDLNEAGLLADEYDPEDATTRVAQRSQLATGRESALPARPSPPAQQDATATKTYVPPNAQRAAPRPAFQVPQPAAYPQPPTPAIAPEPLRPVPTSPTMSGGAGLPPVVASTLLLCAIFSVSGVLALVYLKSKGLW